VAQGVALSSSPSTMQNKTSYLVPGSLSCLVSLSLSGKFNIESMKT
jgi:hypothetical protein